MFEIEGKYTTAKVFAEDVEETCVGQITKMVNCPVFVNPISIMCDTHAGMGSVIGFTMPVSDKVIPNVVGVDIGCGVLSISLGRTLPAELKELDKRIHDVVPMGFNINNRPHWNPSRHDWDHGYSEKWFINKCAEIGCKLNTAINSIGTLGGGNHFIEIGKAKESGDYYLTIHSGSRNFGLRIANYHQSQAKAYIKDKREELFEKQVKELREKYDGAELGKRIKGARESFSVDNLPPDLHYLEGNGMQAYLHDMRFAQWYASKNRHVMAERILKAFEYDRDARFNAGMSAIETVHNFIDFDDNIIRKGSIRSYKGERMIIPFNMRDGILLCEGKSNEDWNCSAPHGAGRLMSRTKAKSVIKLDKFEKQMEGIYSTSVCKSTLDEAPDAYKDAEVIERLIEPTATIIDRIIPVLNIKAT